VRAPWRRPRLVFAYRYGIAGGVSTQLLNRFAAFAGAFDIHVLFSEDMGMVTAFPTGRAEATPSREARTAAIRRLEPDIFVSIDDPEFLRAWRAAGRPGRCVLEVHTTYASGLAYLDTPAALEGVDLIVTVSDYMRRLLADRGLGKQVAPIRVVPNCLDERWRVPDPSTPTPGPRLLWVGKVDAHKRWRSATEIIARSTRELRAAGSDARPVLIGGHSTSSAELRGLTARLRDSPELALAAWWPKVDYELMPSVFSSVAAGGGVVVSASADESFGMSVAEALVCNCPVIAPRVGGLPELLPAEALYEPGDLADGAARATRAVVDPDYRARLLSTVEQVRSATDPRAAYAAYRKALRRIGQFGFSRTMST